MLDYNYLIEKLNEHRENELKKKAYWEWETPSRRDRRLYRAARKQASRGGWLSRAAARLTALMSLRR
ncbi:hypothetical protein [Paenibacillus herberti]|uniref:Uncharacterized protein n=1 Tax=Paenibacillus herberti TaxID=1619309 RepID=A0A229NYU7_9BACL|nr:hypothetical protein [Paenibacillus herberti]OXM14829.1 hypothetical protein CGZ75_18345 [Paenibacillus herberti]